MDATTYARRSHGEVEVRRGGRFAAVGEGESAGGGVSSRGWGGAGEGGGWRTRAPSGSSPAAAAGLVPRRRRKQRWARPAKRGPCRTGRTRSSRPPQLATPPRPPVPARHGRRERREGGREEGRCELGGGREGGRT